MKQIKKAGRVPKLNPCTHRYSFNLNDQDNEQFLKLFELSGMRTKAHFITARVFDKSFRVIKIDKNAVDYHTKLTSFYSQFRAIGVNYNQIVKELKSNFTEKKALAMLFKLEQATIELAKVNREVVRLTTEFEEKWLQKSV